MLSEADAPFDGFLQYILEQAEREWSIVRGFSFRELRNDQRLAYAAAYALIRVGNAVARHSRQLESAYPSYRWVFWVDLRNNLAHQLGVLRVDFIWDAISDSLPELIRTIAGEPYEP